MEALSTEKKLELATNALMQLIEPSGAYNPDRLEHAQNCLKNTSNIVKHTLIKIGVKDCKLCANPSYRDWETDRKSTRLNSSHRSLSRMPSSA